MINPLRTIKFPATLLGVAPRVGRYLHLREAIRLILLCKEHYGVLRMLLPNGLYEMWPNFQRSFICPTMAELSLPTNERLQAVTAWILKGLRKFGSGSLTHLRLFPVEATPCAQHEKPLAFPEYCDREGRRAYGFWRMVLRVVPPSVQYLFLMGFGLRGRESLDHLRLGDEVIQLARTVLPVLQAVYAAEMRKVWCTSCYVRLSNPRLQCYCGDAPLRYDGRPRNVFPTPPLYLLPLVREVLVAIYKDPYSMPETMRQAAAASLDPPGLHDERFGRLRELMAELVQLQMALGTAGVPMTTRWPSDFTLMGRSMCYVHCWPPPRNIIDDTYLSKALIFLQGWLQNDPPYNRREDDLSRRRGLIDDITRIVHEARWDFGFRLRPMTATRRPRTDGLTPAQSEIAESGVVRHFAAPTMLANVVLRPAAMLTRHTAVHTTPDITPPAPLMPLAQFERLLLAGSILRDLRWCGVGGLPCGYACIDQFNGVKRNHVPIYDPLPRNLARLTHIYIAHSNRATPADPSSNYAPTVGFDPKDMADIADPWDDVPEDLGFSYTFGARALAGPPVYDWIHHQRLSVDDYYEFADCESRVNLVG